jgi:hypothetical protein
VRGSLVLSIPMMLMSSGLAHASSGPELANKMNAVTQASMAAFANHPEGDATRQNRVQEIIGAATPRSRTKQAVPLLSTIFATSTTSSWLSTNSLPDVLGFDQ